MTVNEKFKMSNLFYITYTFSIQSANQHATYPKTIIRILQEAKVFDRMNSQ